MPISFTPKSEEDLHGDFLDFKPLPEGKYSFEVLESVDQISKNTGASMIRLNLGIYKGEKIVCRVYDYLLPAMEFKLRHACDACGLLDQYSTGALSAEQFLGRTGELVLKIEKGKKIPDSEEMYPDKNAVKDYVKRDANTPKSIINNIVADVAKADKASQEDLPF